MFVLTSSSSSGHLCSGVEDHVRSEFCEELLKSGFSRFGSKRSCDSGQRHLRFLSLLFSHLICSSMTLGSSKALTHLTPTFSARIEEAKKILSLLESERAHTAALAMAEDEEMDLYLDPVSSGEQVVSLLHPSCSEFLLAFNQEEKRRFDFPDNETARIFSK